MHHITLSNGSIATVPVYDAKQLLLSFLNDSNRMILNILRLAMIFLVVDQQHQLPTYTKSTLGQLGSQHVNIILAMTQMPFHLRCQHFTTKHIQTCLEYCCVHPS